MLRLGPDLNLPEAEVEFTAIRAGGPGGQHVNKVSSAIQLRFAIHASTLPQAVKSRLLALEDRRISADGVVVITARRHRSQARNRQQALRLLGELIARARVTRKARIATRPGRAAKVRRLERKRHRARLKQLRRPVTEA